jgi:hypothetical protein
MKISQSSSIGPAAGQISMIGCKGAPRPGAAFIDSEKDSRRMFASGIIYRPGIGDCNPGEHANQHLTPRQEKAGAKNKT